MDGERDLTFTVDKFFVSPGLDGFEQKDGVKGPIVVESIRAFLRRETAFDNPDTPGDERVALNDTGVLVVNLPEDAGAGAQVGLLHGDVGLEGQGDSQRSTISITIGDVRYGVDVRQPFEVTDFDDEGSPITRTIDEPGNEVVVNAHFFGSSRDNTERQDGSDRTPASTFISSELFNTAAGGVNPALQDENGEPRKGRVGFLVFENFRPETFAAAGGTTGRNRDDDQLSSRVATGGLEDPVTPTNADPFQDEQQFAILRLGTAVGSLDQVPDADLPDPDQVNERTAQTLEGFAAGIGEFQAPDDIGVTPVDAGIPGNDGTPLPPNLDIETDPATNKVGIEMRLTGLQPAPVTLGGLEGTDTNGLTAFVDDDTFGARTPAGDKASGEYAMITALPLTTPTGNPSVRELSGLGDVPVLKHVQWGFFLGERLAEFGGQDVREHVHLGAWAAGQKLPDPGDLGYQWTGTATYQGVAIGNVFRGDLTASGGVSGGNLSTVRGTYSNQWDFGNRSGNVTMDFDGERYTGTTQLRDQPPAPIQSPRFVGALSGAETGRTGRHDGTFVGNPNPLPTGLVGQFSINEAAGATEVYRATGVVAADKK